jgi:hypothetical protein
MLAPFEVECLQCKPDIPLARYQMCHLGDSGELVRRNDVHARLTRLIIYCICIVKVLEAMFFVLGDVGGQLLMSTAGAYTSRCHHPLHRLAPLLDVAL